MMTFEEYRKHDAVALAQLVRDREVSAAELLEIAIARAEAVNPKINAIVRPLYERARERAGQALSGPFAGVPFLLKDLINELAGVPTSHGSAFFKDHIPREDSELVRRYQAAGLVIFGKTNTPELGLTPWTEPKLFGPARNPWDLSRTTGGSSGGSGAAVAAGIVPVANGGDGGGSLRVPASACGLVGLKPTRGRIPTGPSRVEMWQGAASEHVLSRTVRDSAALLDATGAVEAGSGHVFPSEAPFLEQIAQAPRKLRIAFSSKPMMGEGMDAECVKGVEATAKLLSSLGHEVVEDAPQIPREEFTVAFIRMICMETAADYAAGAITMKRKFDPALVEAGTEALRRIGSAMSAECAALARRTLDLHTRHIARWFAGYDLLLQPTLGMKPFKIGALAPGVTDKFQMSLLNHLPIAGLANNPALLLGVGKKTFDWMTNTGVYNVTGQPSISLPLHWSQDGLPIGMMLTARYAQDALLLQVSAQLEQAQPWQQRIAPL